MSTQINLTIGDQRLLQANKTRTAANQQALDDRTATKQLEQKATEAAEAAAPEEQPGALPDTRTGRRPAAQRRQKAEANLLLLSLLHPTNEDPVTYTGSYWQRSVQGQSKGSSGNTYDINFFRSLISVSASLNIVMYKTIKIEPYIYLFEILQPDPGGASEQEPASSKALSAYIYRLYKVASAFYKWVTQYRSLLSVGNLLYNTPVPKQWFTDTNPTAFPFSSINSPITVSAILHSSTADYTYLSYIYIYHECNVVNTEIAPTGFDIVYRSEILTRGATRYVLALYIKIDNKEQTASTRLVSISSRYDSSVARADVKPTNYLYDEEKINFIANMDAQDPRKAIYTSTNRIDYALDPEINGCMYNPETGDCYVTGADKEAKKIFIVQGTLDKALDYNTALRDTAKGIARQIVSNTEEVAGTDLPAGFTLRNKFKNTSGPVTDFGDYFGLPRFIYVMYGS